MDQAYLTHQISLTFIPVKTMLLYLIIKLTGAGMNDSESSWILFSRS